MSTLLSQKTLFTWLVDTLSVLFSLAVLSSFSLMLLIFVRLTQAMDYFLFWL